MTKKVVVVGRQYESAKPPTPTQLGSSHSSMKGTPPSSSGVVQTNDEQPPLDHEQETSLPPQQSPTTIARSSSSSLWELDSTAAVADTVESNDDEIKLKFEVPPELKNILSEVELLTGSTSTTKWLDEVMERDGGTCEMVVEHSKENNDCPSMLISSNDSAIHVRNKKIDETGYLVAEPNDIIRNSPMSSPRHYTIMPQSQIIDADVMRLCCTPPPFNNQQHRTTQSSHQTANTPTPPPSIQRAIKKSSSALASTYNNTQSEWIDPFPTPDVSLHSLYGSPCSSTNLQRRSSDHDESVGEGEKRSSIRNVMNAIPSIPPIEKFSDHCTLSPLRSSSMTAGCAKLSARKVCSESNLPLLERLSMESFWVALNSGPDGNELVSESNKNEVVNINNKKTRLRRRHSEVGTCRLQSEPLGRRRHESEEQAMTPPRLNDKHHSILRSLTAPVESSWEGIRKGSMHIAASTSCIDDEHGIHQTNNPHSWSPSLITSDSRNDYAPGGPKTLTQMRFRALRIKSSKAVASAKNSAGEVFSPVRTVVQQSTQRAAKLVRHTRQRLKERKDLRKQRRLSSIPPPRSWWIVIPADHPYKIMWDVLTMVWAALGAYRTHVRIRDRVFDQSPLIILTEVWFTVDILLNFITEHKTSEGDVIRDGKAVWARYLTTWFLIDILSLIPWERIYVRPIVEQIKRRNFFQKTFFRSKAVVRVSRVLRGRHIKLFGKVSKRTGMSLHRMVALLIKYLPKYLLFLRNMKGALVIRALRFVHWLHEIYKKIWVKARNARQNLAVRRPLFSPNENDFDSESDDEEDDEMDEDDQPRRRLFTES